MSGPKDYGITYTLDRLEKFRRRNEAVQQARAVEVRRALEAARRRAAVGRQREDADRAVALDADRQSRLERSRQALQQAQDALRQAPATPLVPAADLATVPLPIETERNAVPEADQAQADVQGWADALAADTAVATFAAAELAEWTSQAAALPSTTDRVAQARTLIACAQVLHAKAGDTQARFDTRNELLRDVIASMHELGYFVSDPQFADPADPASPVVLKATCGSETVTTTVDLGAMVKSVWDGQEHEHCKESFHDYVDAMKTRGVSVEPEGADLRQRPVLKQKGANELPRSSERQAGG